MLICKPRCPPSGRTAVVPAHPSGGDSELLRPACHTEKRNPSVSLAKPSKKPTVLIYFLLPFSPQAMKY